VYNGIDPSEYVFNPGKRDPSYLFFSKTNWSVKNLKGARQLCRKASVPLWISGENRPTRSRSWITLKRKLGFDRETWIGPMAGEKNAQVLSRSRALLFPVSWPEPFGLVIAEALISGTPVLATPRGSIPELVTPDVGVVLGLE